MIAPLTEDDLVNRVAVLEGGLAFITTGTLPGGVVLRGGVPVLTGPAAAFVPPPFSPPKIDNA